MNDRCLWKYYLGQNFISAGKKRIEKYLYRPQQSWAKVISLQACVCPRGGGCLLQSFGGVCSKFWGGGVCSKFLGRRGVCSKFWGGCLLQILGGVSTQNFGGGCLLQIFGGGLLQIFGGGVCSKFSGGLKFFFLFFFNLFSPPKNSFWDAPPPPETVNARPVRILLECILVNTAVLLHTCLFHTRITRLRSFSFDISIMS